MTAATRQCLPAAAKGAWLQPKCACGSAAGLAGPCPDCARKGLLGLQPKLAIGAPGDRYEREADQAADRVLQGVAAPVAPALSRLPAAPVQREETQAARQEEPAPLADGLALVGKNLGENNPAFSLFTERLAADFMRQPAALSIGVPVFLGANYAFLWSMAMVDPAARRHFDGFNLAMLPGLVPQFPVKTFQYRIEDGAQTRFAFEFGLDASALVQAFNAGVLNTHVSRLSMDSKGRLDHGAVSLSALQVNLGLFGDGVVLSGGFRNGVSPYPLMQPDAAGAPTRVMAQSPALPDLFQGQQDVRFTLNLDLVRLYQHFHPGTANPPGPRIDVARAPLPGAQPAAAPGGGLDAGAAVQATLAASGAPLPATTRRFMEARFGHDFGRVRIHADSGAAASARAVGARAYTVGADIVFGRGQYAPATASGRHLLAHELAHVVQQSAGSPAALQRVPDAAGVQADPPRYAYSTHCGWIDWGHAQPGLMRDLIARVRTASQIAAVLPAGEAVTTTGPTMESAPGGVTLTSATPTANINRTLTDGEVLSVALRMFMDQSMAFEERQAWTDWVGESSFSEEDLASNLIGFYRAVHGYAREDIGDICDIWSATDSLGMLENYSFQDQQAFSDHALWPDELSTIQPADAHGELMDMVSMHTNTLWHGPRTTNLLGPERFADPALQVAPVGGGNPIDISGEASGAEGAPMFEVQPRLPPGHGIGLRWGLRDAADEAYAMWSAAGPVHQYGSQTRAYIGSQTRALLRERGIHAATVRCRMRLGQTERLLSFDAQFTW